MKKYDKLGDSFDELRDAEKSVGFMREKKIESAKKEINKQIKKWQK